MSAAVRGGLDGAHHGAFDKAHAERARMLTEEVLEEAAVELIGGRRKIAARAELRDGTLEIRIPA